MERIGQHRNGHGSASPEASTELLRRIAEVIASVRYGSVKIVIQDARVVQIEREEKFRFDKP
jgi:hypothetical protein